MRLNIANAKSPRRLRRYVCIALTFACVGACGSDDTTSGPIDLLDGGSPSIDASLGTDGGEGGSSQADGGDAGTPDGAIASSTYQVRSDSESVVAERFFDPQSAVSVAAHPQGALLSWTQFGAGKSRVHSRWFGVSAGAVDAQNLADDSTQLEAHSAATSTGFLTTWSDDVSGHVELRARRTTVDGVPLDSTPVAITNDGANHNNPVSAQGADGKILVAFLNATTRRGSTLLLGADAKPAGDAHDVPGFDAIEGRPALAELGTGYVLAWVDTSARRVHLQSLDAAGVPSGAGVLIDSEGAAQGNVELATSAMGGAVTWDVLVSGARAEVRFRTFDVNSTPVTTEHTVTPYPDTGLHPSVVATRGGYLVAYRSAVASTIALRIVMLDGRGDPVSSDNRALTVTSLQQQDLPLAMRMTSDGQNIFVGWLDQTPNTLDYQLQRAWIGCN